MSDTLVSIPFKRESVFRVKHAMRQVKFKTAFQFPSNGKVYSERYQDPRTSRLTGSFNSLQTGKCIQRAWMLHQRDRKLMSFNSLQTGKWIQSGNWPFAPVSRNLFQFPSNGKVYSEVETPFGNRPPTSLFQFPSNGKVYSES